MSRGINKVILVGNLGANPEIRYLPNGNAVTNITLATTDSWKDKQTGQQQAAPQPTPDYDSFDTDIPF